MFTKYLKLITLVAVLSLVLLSGSIVLAQTAIPETPGVCTEANKLAIPGCNPPINTGIMDQIKAGGLGVGTFGIKSSGAINTASDLNSGTSEPDATRKAPHAGVINYIRNYTLDWNGNSPFPTNIPSISPRDVLVIVGAARSLAGDRLVKIWDNLDVVGEITANTVKADRYELCTLGESCQEFTGTGSGDSSWGTTIFTSPTVNYNAIYNKNSGNVGIGTEAPSAKFQVNGITYLNNFVYFGGEGNSTGDSGGSLSSGVSSVTLSARGARDLNLTSGVGKDVRIKTGGTDTMILKSSGNVGIGNTAPSTLLEVGNSAFAGPAYVSANSAADKVAGFSWKNAGTAIWYLFKPNDGSNNLTLRNSSGVDVTVFKQDGNVGIGVTNPQSKLHVSGRLNTMIKVESTETGNQKTGIEFSELNDNLSANILLINGSLGFNLSNTPYLDVLINNNGNVGIGTNAPNSKLHIGTSDTTRGLRIEGPTSASSIASLSLGGNGEVQVDKPGVVGGRFIIKDDGNVGINTGDIGPGAKLDVVGKASIGSLIIPYLDGTKGDVIDLGLGDTGREPNAGKIAYKNWSTDALDVVGAGTTDTNRLVRIYDNLLVPGTTTLNTLVVNNVCTGTGDAQVCNSTLGDSNWKKTAVGDIYNTNGSVLAKSFLYFGGGDGAVADITRAAGKLSYGTDDIFLMSQDRNLNLRTGDSKDLRLQTNTGGTINNRLVIKNNGDIGVGTSNPLSDFHLVRKKESNLTIESTGDGAGYSSGQKTGIRLVDSWRKASAGIDLWSEGGLGFDVISSSALDMYISPIGNVGIGKEPSEKLDVDGRIKSKGLRIPSDATDSSVGIELGYGVPNKSAASGKIVYQRWDTEALEIVGAGTDADQVAKDRKVRIYDDLWVEDAIYANRICSATAGTCLSVNTLLNHFDILTTARNGDWGSFGACSVVQCGQTGSTQMRTCNDPSPSTDPVGAECERSNGSLTTPDNRTESRACPVVACPIPPTMTVYGGPNGTGDPVAASTAFPFVDEEIQSLTTGGYFRIVVDMKTWITSCNIQNNNGDVILDNITTNKDFWYKSEANVGELSLHCARLDPVIGVKTRVKPYVGWLNIERRAGDFTFTWNSASAEQYGVKVGEGDETLGCTINVTSNYYKKINSDWVIQPGSPLTNTPVTGTSDGFRENVDSACPLADLNILDNERCTAAASISCTVREANGLTSNTVTRNMDETY